MATASMESAHHFSYKRDCYSTADVPSFTRLTALSAIPFISGRWGVEVRLFHDKSSQYLPNSNDLSVEIDIRPFRRLEKVS